MPVSLASMHSDYEDFEFTAKFVRGMLKRLKDFNFPQKTLLNVNVPLLDADDIAGIAITELGSRMFTNTYEKRVDPRGKVYYWMAGELTNESADSNSDISAIRQNKISITPVTYEMTKEEVMTDLEKRFAITMHAIGCKTEGRRTLWTRDGNI